MAISNGSTWLTTPSGIPISSSIGGASRPLGFRFGDWVNIKDFGAVGDGVTNDSAAFQAAADYVDSHERITTILIPESDGFYLADTVDLKTANLRGAGFTRDRNAAIIAGDGIERLFTWDGSEISSIVIQSETNKSATAFWMDSGYNRRFVDVEIGRFEYAIYVQDIVVNFYIDMSTFHTNVYGFYCEDKDSRQATTIHVSRTMYQWCENCIVFERDVFGATFDRNIYEQIKTTALSASWWGSCAFTNSWWEGKQVPDAAATDAIETTIGQGFNECIFDNNYVRSPWVDNASPDFDASSDENQLTRFDGAVRSGTGLVARSRYGSSLRYDASGIEKMCDQWLGDGDDPDLSRRDLNLVTPNQAPSSGYRSDIALKLGTLGSAVIEARDSTFTTSPRTKLHVDGYVDEGGKRPYARLVAKQRTVSVDIPHNKSSEALGGGLMLRAPIVAVWDSTPGNSSTDMGGMTITEISTGHIRIESPDDSAGDSILGDFQDPGLSVSGVFSSSFLQHRVSHADAYGSSWATYRVCRGFNIYFADNAGTAVTPERFTVLIFDKAKTVVA